MAAKICGTGFGAVNPDVFDAAQAMDCFIYKGCKKADAYLYSCRKNEFHHVPQTLLALLGKLQYVMSINLNKDSKLANARVETVLSQLRHQGYYLQLPPIPEPQPCTGLHHEQVTRS